MEMLFASGYDACNCLSASCPASVGASAGIASHHHAGHEGCAEGTFMTHRKKSHLLQTTRDFLCASICSHSVRHQFSTLKRESGGGCRQVDATAWADSPSGHVNGANQG